MFSKVIVILIVALCFLGGWIWLALDDYKHSVCPKCTHNLYCKRKNGRVICSKHDDVTELVLASQISGDKIDEPDINEEYRNYQDYHDDLDD